MQATGASTDAHSGHTHDLVITRSEANIDCLRVGEMLSDHALVIFKADVKKVETGAALDDEPVMAEAIITQFT